MATTAGQILVLRKQHNSAPVQEQPQPEVKQAVVEQPAVVSQVVEEVQVPSVQHPTQIEKALEKGMMYLIGAWVVLFVVVIIGVAVERSGNRKRAQK